MASQTLWASGLACCAAGRGWLPSWSGLWGRRAHSPRSRSCPAGETARCPVTRRSDARPALSRDRGPAPHRPAARGSYRSSSFPTTGAARAPASGKPGGSTSVPLHQSCSGWSLEVAPHWTGELCAVRAWPDCTAAAAAARRRRGGQGGGRWGEGGT